METKHDTEAKNEQHYIYNTCRDLREKKRTSPWQEVNITFSDVTCFICKQHELQNMVPAMKYYL